jgi:hypothetical protein
MSNQYGKIPLVSGQRILQDVGGTGLSGIVIGNESGLTCSVTLQGANVKKTLYPGTVDKFIVPQGRSWNGNVQIDPVADLNNIISWPSSHIYIDTYGVNEEITGQYPFVLNRAGNVGNPVSFVSGSSTSVQNDNNASGTQVVEMTVLGSPSSNEVHNNDGSGWIGRWINPTFTKMFQWFSAGTTALQLGATGLLTEILGTFKVDQTLTVVGTSSLDNGAITTDGAGNETATSVTATTINATTVGATTVNVGTVNATTVNATGNFNPLGNVILENNVPLQIEDSGDTARNVLTVDASNIVTLSGITTKDQANVQNAAATIKFIFDLVLGLLTIPGTKQTITGNTSGTFDIYECFAGPIKLVIGIQANYRDTNTFANVTLKTAFTKVAFIVATSTGGIVTGTGGVADTMRQVTWGTGTTAGSHANGATVPQDAAGFSPGAFTQVGSNNYGSAHDGICIIIGV